MNNIANQENGWPSGHGLSDQTGNHLTNPTSPLSPQKTPFPPEWMKTFGKFFVLILVVILFGKLAIWGWDIFCCFLDEAGHSLKRAIRGISFIKGLRMSGVESLAFIAMIIIGAVGALKLFLKKRR